MNIFSKEKPESVYRPKRRYALYPYIQIWRLLYGSWCCHIAKFGNVHQCGGSKQWNKVILLRYVWIVNELKGCFDPLTILTDSVLSSKYFCGLKRLSVLCLVLNQLV